MARLFLGLQSSGTPIGTNDDWRQHPGLSALRQAMIATGAFTLNEGGKDAAILVTPDPGMHTVHTTSADQNTGVALAEIYEAP